MYIQSVGETERRWEAKKRRLVKKELWSSNFNPALLQHTPTMAFKELQLISIVITEQVATRQAKKSPRGATAHRWKVPTRAHSGFVGSY